MLLHVVSSNSIVVRGAHTVWLLYKQLLFTVLSSPVLTLPCDEKPSPLSGKMGKLLPGYRTWEGLNKNT